RGLAVGGRGVDLRSLVVDPDGQGRRAGIAVAVLQRVGEGLAGTARRARIAGVGVAAVGMQLELAVLALNGQAVAGIVVRRLGRVADDAGDGRTVGTLGVGTRAAQAAGGAFAGHHVAFGFVGGVVDRVGVVARGRDVINDVDAERGARLVAILVRDEHVEAFVDAVLAGDRAVVLVVVQHVVVGDLAGRSIVAG